LVAENRSCGALIPMSLKPLMLSANDAPEAGFEFALEHKFKKMQRTGCV
jgi:hypothetical protein